MPGYHRFRLPPDYTALAALSARGFAWEWCRRDPGFRAAWAAAPRACQRAAATACAAALRSRRARIDIPSVAGGRRWARWGLTFRPGAGHARERRPAGRLVARGRCRGAHYRSPGAVGAPHRGD